MEGMLPVKLGGEANPILGKGQFAARKGWVKNWFASGRSRDHTPPGFIKNVAYTDLAFRPAINGLDIRIPDRPAGHFNV
jgi:hypothetical protein